MAFPNFDTSGCPEHCSHPENEHKDTVQYLLDSNRCNSIYITFPDQPRTYRPDWSIIQHDWSTSMVFNITNFLERTECSSAASITKNMNTILLYYKLIYARSCLLTLVRELFKTVWHWLFAWVIHYLFRHSIYSRYSLNTNTFCYTYSLK